jgi:hypothetical protein
MLIFFSVFTMCSTINGVRDLALSCTQPTVAMGMIVRPLSIVAPQKVPFYGGGHVVMGGTIRSLSPI